MKTKLLVGIAALASTGCADYQFSSQDRMIETSIVMFEPTVKEEQMPLPRLFERKQESEPIVLNPYAVFQKVMPLYGLGTSIDTTVETTLQAGFRR